MKKKPSEGDSTRNINIQELCNYLQNGQYNTVFNLTNDYIENFRCNKYPELINNINTNYGYDYKKEASISFGKRSMENLIKNVFPLRLISLSLGDIGISNEKKLDMAKSTYDIMKDWKDIVRIGNEDWKKIEKDYSSNIENIERSMTIEQLLKDNGINSTTKDPEDNGINSTTKDPEFKISNGKIFILQRMNLKHCTNEVLETLSSNLLNKFGNLALENGDYELAKRLSDISYNRAIYHTETLKKIHNGIEANLLRINTTLCDVNTPLNDRIIKILKIYDKCIIWAKDSFYNKTKYIEILEDYLKFLEEYKDKSEGIITQEKIETIKKSIKNLEKSE